MAKYNMSLRYNPNDENHLRDAQHALNLFRANNFELAPKNKFLYHVVFALKDEEVRTLAPTVRENNKEIAVLAKSVDLPGFRVSVETKQQYNRKKNYQTRIDYEECRVIFHDDNAGLTTAMLREYYNFFYRDGIQNNNNNFGTRNKYGEHRHRYGLDNGSRDSFFDFIKIYQLARKQWFSFTLVNPILTAWNHDNLDYGDASGMMENTINIAYEAVYYDNGDIKTELDGNSTTAVINSEIGEPTNFGSPETGYDLTHSPLISNGTPLTPTKSPQDAKSRAAEELNAEILNNFLNSPPLTPLPTERGPLPPLKNNTQTDDTLASAPEFNQLGTTDLASPETIAAELDADPELQDTVVKQSVLKGEVEGYDSTNASEFDNLSEEEKGSVKDSVINKATSTDRTKSENIKAASTASSVIDRKKQRNATATSDAPLSDSEYDNISQQSRQSALQQIKDEGQSEESIQAALRSGALRDDEVRIDSNGRLQVTNEVKDNLADNFDYSATTKRAETLQGEIASLDARISRFEAALANPPEGITEAQIAQTRERVAVLESIRAENQAELDSVQASISGDF